MRSSRRTSRRFAIKENLGTVLARSKSVDIILSRCKMKPINYLMKLEISFPRTASRSIAAQLKRKVEMRER